MKTDECINHRFSGDRSGETTKLKLVCRVSSMSILLMAVIIYRLSVIIIAHFSLLPVHVIDFIIMINST